MPPQVPPAVWANLQAVNMSMINYIEKTASDVTSSANTGATGGIVTKKSSATRREALQNINYGACDDFARHRCILLVGITFVRSRDKSLLVN